MNLRKFLISIFFISLAFYLPGQTAKVDVFASMNKTKKTDLAEITTFLSYTRLSPSNNAALIGRIRTCAVNDSYIIIYDDMSNRLLIFDNKGTYLRDLLIQGKGPNEFIGITSIDILPDNEILILKDCRDISIMNSEGLIKKQFRIRGTALFAKWLNEKVITLIYSYPNYLNNNGFEISFIDLAGRVLSNSLRNSIVNVDYNEMNPYISCGWNRDTLYYWNQFRDTVYSITQDLKVIPRLVLKHSKQKYPIESIKKGGMLRPDFTFYLGYIEDGYFEFRDMALMSIGYKDKTYRLLINPKNGDGNNLLYDYNSDHYQGFKNNLDGGSEYWPRFITRDGDMVMTIDPNNLRETFLRHRKNKDIVRFPNQQDSLQKNIIDKISLMDNPIFIKIKK
jgi:hypothetical protein